MANLGSKNIKEKTIIHFKHESTQILKPEVVTYETISQFSCKEKNVYFSQLTCTVMYVRRNSDRGAGENMTWYCPTDRR